MASCLMYRYRGLAVLVRSYRSSVSARREAHAEFMTPRDFL